MVWLMAYPSRVLGLQLSDSLLSHSIQNPTYTYIHTYTHTHIHTYIQADRRTDRQTRIHTYMHTYIRTDVMYLYIRSHTDPQTCAHTHTHTHICPYLYMCMSLCVHASINIHIYIYTYIHIYIYTYTYIYIYGRVVIPAPLHFSIFGIAPNTIQCGGCTDPSHAPYREVV